MAIDIRNFVDINIKPTLTREVNASRDTVLLYTNLSLVDSSSKNYDGTIISSIDEATSLIETTLGKTSTDWGNLKLYMSRFFENGGQKIKLYGGATFQNIVSKIKERLYDNEIACGYSFAGSGSGFFVGSDEMMGNAVYSLSKESEFRGLAEKLFVYSAVNVNDINNIQTASGTTTLDPKTVSNFIGGIGLGQADAIILAYLSQLYAYGLDTVKDYAFTRVNSDQTPDESLINEENLKHFNFYTTIGDQLYSVGGNCTNGLSLTNEFCRILLCQTLTQRLMNLLTQKIKSNTGISKMYSVISEELERYRRSGYLTTDKVYTDEDLTVRGADGVDYTIIQKGTALLNGYLVKILPMSALSETEKASHSAPPIYVIIADQYAIRKITVNGEVI